MANFDFSIEGMEQWLRKVEKHGVAVQRRAAQILGRRIIIATPKKTGFLLANARMGLNITPTGDRWVRPPGYEARGIKARKLNQVSRLAARMLTRRGVLYVETGSALSPPVPLGSVRTVTAPEAPAWRSKLDEPKSADVFPRLSHPHIIQNSVRLCSRVHVHCQDSHSLKGSHSLHL